MTSSLSKYEGKLPSPFSFFIQGHFRSILLDGYKLLFSLGVVVSVELSVACNIHIRENERGRCFSDVNTVYTIFFFNFPANDWLNPKYLA